MERERKEKTEQATAEADLVLNVYVGVIFAQIFFLLLLLFVFQKKIIPKDRGVEHFSLNEFKALVNLINDTLTNHIFFGLFITFTTQ